MGAHNVPILYFLGAYSMNSQDIRGSINSLLEGIQFLIDKAVNKASFDKTYRGYISEVNGDTYTVVIENMAYSETRTINASTKLSVGDVVLVLFPRNSSSNRIILR